MNVYLEFVFVALNPDLFTAKVCSLSPIENSSECQWHFELISIISSNVSPTTAATTLDSILCFSLGFGHGSFANVWMFIHFWEGWLAGDVKGALLITSKCYFYIRKPLTNLTSPTLISLTTTTKKKTDIQLFVLQQKPRR